MKSDRCDLFSKLEFARYYQLNSINSTPEMILPTEKQSSSLVSTAAHTRSSEKGVIVALGFISTLLLFGGLQLYRSVNVNSAQVKPIKSNQTFTFNTGNLEHKIHLEEFDNFADLQKIKISTIQNSISQGKF